MIQTNSAALERGLSRLARNETRALGGAAILVAIGWMTIITYVLHASLPFNPIRLPYAERIQARFWIPEGWGFFTRNPREERVTPYAWRADGWISASLGPHGRSSNLFGLNRISRAQNVEMGLLLQRVPNRMWRDCTGSSTACIDSVTRVPELRNRSPRPTLCGDIAFVRQQPIPWAWVRLHGAVMPSRVTRIRSKC